jgi:hypothetical protein
VYDNYGYLGRKKVVANQKYASFIAKKKRFYLFLLYFLAIKLEKRQDFLKSASRAVLKYKQKEKKLMATLA